MVGLYVKIKADPDKRHELMQLFDYAEEGTEEGCVDRSIHKDIRDPNIFLLIEKWSDQNLLKAYLDSDKFHSILGGMKVLGTLDQFSTLGFKELSTSSESDL